MQETCLIFAMIFLEYKVAVEKIQEILKRPEYMNFLKSDQFQKFMEPASLKEFVQSEDFKKLQEPATIQQLMRTPTFINLISTPDVIQLLEKTKTGPFIAKLPQLAPRLLQALQTRILSGGSIPSANSIIQVAQG
jgi:hypothetical protein